MALISYNSFLSPLTCCAWGGAVFYFWACMIHNNGALLIPKGLHPNDFLEWIQTFGNLVYTHAFPTAYAWKVFWMFQIFQGNIVRDLFSPPSSGLAPLYTFAVRLPPAAILAVVVPGLIVKGLPIPSEVRSRPLAWLSSQSDPPFRVDLVSCTTSSIFTDGSFTSTLVGSVCLFACVLGEAERRAAPLQVQRTRVVVHHARACLRATLHGALPPHRHHGPPWYWSYRRRAHCRLDVSALTACLGLGRARSARAPNPFTLRACCCCHACPPRCTAACAAPPPHNASHATCV
jgi:hypothetical protein